MPTMLLDALAAVEVAAFLLPALPSSLRVRLLVLGAYACAHMLGAHRAYARAKQGLKAQPRRRHA